MSPTLFLPHPSSLIPHPSSLIPHPSSLSFRLRAQRLSLLRLPSKVCIFRCKVSVAAANRPWNK